MERSEIEGRTRYGYYALTRSHELYSCCNRWQVWKGLLGAGEGRTSVSNTDRVKNNYFNRLILKYDLQSWANLIPPARPPLPSPNLSPPPTSPQNHRWEIGAFWLLRGFIFVLGGGGLLSHYSVQDGSFVIYIL